MRVHLVVDYTDMHIFLQVRGFSYFLIIAIGCVNTPKYRYRYLFSRAVDPHSFLVDPDLTVLLNADPDPAAF